MDRDPLARGFPRSVQASSPLAVASSAHTRIRHSVPADHEFLYYVETNGERTIHYRLGGAAPGFAAYVERLWQSVLVLFIVESLDGRPLGATMAYEPDFMNGHCKIAAVMAPNLPVGSYFHEGVSLFLTHLFRAFPFRKLYGEVAEHNFAQFSTGHFVEEGRLRKHMYIDGDYEDMLVIALYRETFLETLVDTRAALGLSSRVRAAEESRVEQEPFD
jgi:RimJ/RimL family protein N-acetyltransferase